MNHTTMPALVMILGSSFGAQLLAQDAAPATPVDPPASVEIKTTETATDKTTATVKAQIEAATKAFDKEAGEFMQKLRAEKDRNKQRELFSQRPQPTETVELILELAGENPKAEGVEQGLVWCLRSQNAGHRKETGKLLLTHYNESKALGRLAMSYGRMPNGGEDELREIIEKAGDETVRQSATYYLASKLTKNAETKAEGLAMMKKLQEWPKIAETNPRLLDQVKGELFVAENLSVGSSAPDIVGTDHEGEEFKLSDYKGKVVLLDFWGIW